jgi:hypothetical protein
MALVRRLTSYSFLRVLTIVSLLLLLVLITLTCAGINRLQIPITVCYDSQQQQQAVTTAAIAAVMTRHAL